MVLLWPLAVRGYTGFSCVAVSYGLRGIQQVFPFIEKMVVTHRVRDEAKIAIHGFISLQVFSFH